jgi:hypothetical protein
MPMELHSQQVAIVGGPAKLNNLITGWAIGPTEIALNLRQNGNSA